MADSDDPSRREGRSDRRELLRRAGVGAVSAGIAGSGLGPAFYGPLRFKGRWLKGDLTIIQWIHFVPDYDKWFDNTWTKQWGEKNDVDVHVDHINNALLFSTGSSEVAAQSGHDLFQFLSPPSSFQKQVIPMDDLVQEVTRKLGKMSDVAYRSTF